MIKAIRTFRERTRELYKQEEEKAMDPWKRDVMRIHERSEFLFYFDDCEWETEDGRELLVHGELVKGLLPPGSPLFLFDGQGRKMGEGILLSDPETKEEKRRGLIRPKKNEFRLKITALGDKAAEEMAGGAGCRRMLRVLIQDLSLITDAAAFERA